MHALCLQGADQVGQLGVCHAPPLAFVADAVILAVGAAQRAAAEKHGAAAARAADARFLPHVRGDAGDHGLRPHTAEAVSFFFVSLRAAPARTQGTDHELPPKMD